MYSLKDCTDCSTMEAQNEVPNEWTTNARILLSYYSMAQQEDVRGALADLSY